ncbi:DnaJ domain-containing protein [Rhexocercosporidium sp. MPI-PUGE-AT-0058]|nr:DnaJ domain-containing protein [Rhexocercosporidium sp. MPI-PUGE-AT-0058]
MASYESHYEILGLEQGASLKEITIVYRKLALKSHPDKNKEDANATEKFQKISNAHDILKDEKARAHYDHNLSRHKAAWEAKQANEAKQQRRQSANSHKIAALEKKKAMIERVIQAQQEEVQRLRSKWATLHSGEIPHGFEDFQSYGGDNEEVYMAIREKLCELLLDLQQKMQTANSVSAEVNAAIKEFQ